jgi:hypothetical protein
MSCFFFLAWVSSSSSTCTSTDFNSFSFAISSYAFSINMSSSSCLVKSAWKPLNILSSAFVILSIFLSITPSTNPVAFSSA